MFYNFTRFICRIVLALIRRWEVTGVENFPREGGLVIVSNHISYWDPVAVGCAVNRQVHFMAKHELFKIPLLGPVIHICGAFPVRRDRSDRNAVRIALKLLRDGKVVGVFPEGTRSHTGELLEAHAGAAMLALKAEVPLLPVAVSGTRGVFGKIKVHIGKPVQFQEDIKVARDAAKKASEKVMEQISSLLAEVKSSCQ